MSYFETLAADLSSAVILLLFWLTADKAMPVRRHFNASSLQKGGKARRTSLGSFELDR
jgi:hypothetical protein